ncbi:ATP-binding protein [Hoeflea sp. WL0058]|uniref:histidine kinase n=1 Tax=Flavimaribacter sediminis TaxID=2865987 RepID=A0AAE2ZSD4_9HYPH|nr:histidine kinase dimerization/phosphoacceptor domain -containing protein [Flavimaribacter sediminis]MBW8638627.1 ATP-binding protein [Flavimaribacter sediminis]
MKSVVTSISLEQDTDVSHTRRSARLIAKVGGADNRDQIRFATAVSEIARNAFQYGKEGVAEFSFSETKQALCLVARVQDHGGGIADLASFLRNRHQAHTGPGLGLSGSQKLVDDFSIETGETGTIVDLKLNLKLSGSASELAKAAADALVKAAHGSPLEELTEQNRALRDALAAQQYLLREMHHRTKNNLAIIQSLAMMQARQSSSEETRKALTDFTGRIQAFANAHNLLHQAEDVSQVDLKQHIEDLADRLRLAFDQSRIAIEVDCEPLMISFDAATEIGLIVNELLTNAVKHVSADQSSERKVWVDAKRVGSKVRLTVRDNGPGIVDAEKTLRKSRSLGWKIVQGSVRKLNAALQVDGTDGLSVAIELDAHGEG